MRSKRGDAYSFKHTQERLQERYGLEILKKEYDKITTQIRLTLFPDYMEIDAGETQGIYECLFKGKRVVFVYSFTHHRIKTVLPMRIRGNWETK